MDGSGNCFLVASVLIRLSVALLIGLLIFSSNVLYAWEEGKILNGEFMNDNAYIAILCGVSEPTGVINYVPTICKVIKGIRGNLASGVFWKEHSENYPRDIS